MYKRNVAHSSVLPEITKQFCLKMFLFFLVTGALIALCSASTCNVYRAEEKGIQTIPYEYICCNNTHQVNCAGNVYGIGSDSNYCDTEGNGKVGFQFGTSFECGSCLTQIKCAERTQQSPRNAKRWPKAFKECCLISSNLDIKTNHDVFIRQVSICGNGICDFNETCNCTQDCPTSTGKTTRCKVNYTTGI